MYYNWDNKKNHKKGETGFLVPKMTVTMLTLCKLLRWGPYLQRCLWGINMGKLKLSQISYPVAHCGKGFIYQLRRVQVVSHMGNIWIGPWANFPYYMDPTFLIRRFLGLFHLRSWGGWIGVDFADFPDIFKGPHTFLFHSVPLRIWNGRALIWNEIDDFHRKWVLRSQNRCKTRWLCISNLRWHTE